MMYNAGLGVSRALLLSVLVSIVLITAAYFPPFPPQFGAYLTEMIVWALKLEPWFPVRLAFSLWSIGALVDLALITFKYITWLKDWLLGRPAVQSPV